MSEIAPFTIASFVHNMGAKQSVLLCYALGFGLLSCYMGRLFYRYMALKEKFLSLKTNHFMRKAPRSNTVSKPIKSTKKIFSLFQKNGIYIPLLGPFIVLLGLVAVLSFSLKAKKYEHPQFISLIATNKYVPDMSLPPLFIKGKTLQSENLLGRVKLVNFWSSWCKPCRDEIPFLKEISQDKRFDIIGINYKDNIHNARRFLYIYENPFKISARDETGNEAAQWGVVGVPETFLIGKDNQILYKYSGPLTAEIYKQYLLPSIEKALLEK